MKPFQIFQQLPCKTCQSECCYHVPATRQHVEKILEHLKDWDSKDIERMKAMVRPAGMCPFVDTEKWSCAVYKVRPMICQRFGYTPKMPCSYAPELSATIGRAQALQEFQESFAGATEDDITLLGDLFSWDDITVVYSDEHS